MRRYVLVPTSISDSQRDKNARSYYEVIKEVCEKEITVLNNFGTRTSKDKAYKISGALKRLDFMIVVRESKISIANERHEICKHINFYETNTIDSLLDYKAMKYCHSKRVDDTFEIYGNMVFDMSIREYERYRHIVEVPVYTEEESLRETLASRHSNRNSNNFFCLNNDIENAIQEALVAKFPDNFRRVIYDEQLSVENPPEEGFLCSCSIL